MTAGSDTKAAASALLDLKKTAPRAVRSFHPISAASLTRFSDEQEQALAFRCDRLVITALAGTGKSRVLAEFAKREPQKKWHYLAFNKSMAIEAAKSMPGVSSRTLHSLAYSAFGRPYAGKLDRCVGFDEILLECGAPRSGGKELAIVIEATVQRYIASSDDDLHTGHVPLHAWAQWRDRENCSISIEEVVGFAGSWWASMVKHDGVAPMDLDALIKLMQLAKHVPLTGKGAVFLVDESQDLTPCSRAWLDELPHRVIRAGDPFQSIYGWRMQGLDYPWLGNGKEAWLTGSWRFGPEVADLVNPLLFHLGSSRGLTGLGERTIVCTEPDGHETLISRTRSTLKECVSDAWKAGRAVDPQWAPWLVSGAPDDDLLAQGVEDAQPLLPAGPGFRQGGVLAMTAHASKGGSFDAVRVLPDFHWPCEPSRGCAIEEARVLYVALTRAKRRLVLDPALLQGLMSIRNQEVADVADAGF